MADINTKPDPGLWNPSTTAELSPVGTLRSTSGVTKGQYRTFSYPKELGTARYPYYMMFYINASSKSKLVEQGGTTLPNVSTSSRNVGQGVAQGSSDSTIIQFVNTNTAALSGGKVEAIPVKKRLNIAMALPLPVDVNFSHNANYDLIGASGILGSVLKTFNSENLKEGAKGLISDVPAMVGQDIAGAIGAATGTDFAALANKIMGIARNERKEQSFRGMEPRTFTFTWLLIPRTADESDTIYDIIKLFKYNQYPEIPSNSSGLNVIVPNEVDIEFHGLNGELQTISKISTCVIDSVHTNYTPLGKWVTFDGTDNPVATQLTLVFKEIEPMTRQQISLGY